MSYTPRNPKLTPALANRTPRKTGSRSVFFVSGQFVTAVSKFGLAFGLRYSCAPLKNIIQIVRAQQYATAWSKRLTTCGRRECVFKGDRENGRRDAVLRSTGSLLTSRLLLGSVMM